MRCPLVSLMGCQIHPADTLLALGLPTRPQRLMKHELLPEIHVSGPLGTPLHPEMLRGCLRPAFTYSNHMIVQCMCGEELHPTRTAEPPQHLHSVTRCVSQQHSPEDHAVQMCVSQVHLSAHSLKDTQTDAQTDRRPQDVAHCNPALKSPVTRGAGLPAP